MKKLMLALVCGMLVGPAVLAGDKGTVLIPRQFTQSMRSIIPEKTDQFKVTNMALRPTQLGQALRTLLDSVDRANYEQPHFALWVHPLAADDVEVVIETHDPMLYDAAQRKRVKGVVKVGSSYFTIMPGQKGETGLATETLLDQLLQKSGGKTKFERIFELVADPINYRGSRVVAVWNGKKLTVRSAVVNGERVTWSF